MIARGIRRKSKYVEVFPSGVDEPMQIGLRIGRWIGGDDVEATCQVQGGPGRANGSAPTIVIFRISLFSVIVLFLTEFEFLIVFP